MSEDDDTREFKLPRTPEFVPNETTSISLDESTEDPEPAAEGIPAMRPEIAHMLSIANQQPCKCAQELRWHASVIKRPEDPEPKCFRCNMISFLNG